MLSLQLTNKGVTIILPHITAWELRLRGLPEAIFMRRESMAEAGCDMQKSQFTALPLYYRFHRS